MPQIVPPKYVTVGDLKKILDNLGTDHDLEIVMIAVGDEAVFLTDVMSKVHEPVWYDGHDKTLRSLYDKDTMLGSQRTVVLRG